MPPSLPKMRSRPTCSARPISRPRSPPARASATSSTVSISCAIRYKEPNRMPVSIRQIHPVFVGEVAGVDCRKPLSPENVAAIEAGMDEYAVLVFRDQNITDEEQIAFTRHFGELERYQTAGHIRKR